MTLLVPQSTPHQIARLLNNYKIMVGATPIQTYNQQLFYPTIIPMQSPVTTSNKFIFIHKLSTLLRSEVYTTFISQP